MAQPCRGPMLQPWQTRRRTCKRRSPGSAQAEQAVGELLFAAGNLARQAGVDPEQALQKANEAFCHSGRAGSLKRSKNAFIYFGGI
jgi:Protein containing tetrapyrrole methyltransferase domain and MazG-like (predicted pyrophosphatase) domain